MKTTPILLLAGCICLSIFSLSSCKKEPKPDPNDGKKDLAIVSMVSNPDGYSGTCWMQIIDGSTPKTVDNSLAHQIGFGMPPMDVFGNDIYTIPDYNGSNTFQKWTKQEDGTLLKNGSFEVPVSSFVTHGKIYSAEKGYLATRTGKLLTFNPKTMTMTKEIDLSEYAGEGVSVPFFGSFFFEGKLMYVPLWQTNMQHQPMGDPMIEFLIINVETDEVVKYFKETQSGLTSAGYPYGVQKNCFKDERGDIYYVAGGAFSQDPKFKTGILRIKNGTQEIDPDYNWVFNDQVIEGEPGKTVWLASTHYLGNGKLYGMMDIADYWENPSMPNWTRDRSIISVEIDLYAKTVKKLPIPRTCAYATHVSTYNDLLVFSVWGEQESGFYTYDPNTGEVSDGSVIKVPGFPFWCYQFK